MDEILIFILILAPGLTAVMARKYFKKRKRKKVEGYVELFYMAAHGFVVFGFMSTINYFAFNITTMAALLKWMDRVAFFFFYAATSAVLAVLWMWFWEAKGSEALNWVRNKYLKKKYGLTMSTNPTVWDEIFNEKEQKDEWKIVSIFRDGHLVTAGIVTLYNASDADVMEFKLLWSPQVMKILEADKGKEREEDKILNVVKYDYYNVDTGQMIRFHDSRKLREREVLNTFY